jgi:small acid-soluble spore protein O (minor)
MLFPVLLFSIIKILVCLIGSFYLESKRFEVKLWWKSSGFILDSIIHINLVKISLEVIEMAKRKANHVIPTTNAASAQGMGAGYNEEYSNEPLTEMQKKNNKKRKKNQ